MTLFRQSFTSELVGAGRDRTSGLRHVCWLENMHANPGLGEVDARPEDATDRCYSDTGQVIASGETTWDGVWNDRKNGACMDAYPIFSNPRIVAGDDYVGDIFKCHLQSVDEAIAKGLYAPVDVSAHVDDLARIYPDGVCDYSRGDVGRPDNILSKN